MAKFSQTKFEYQVRDQERQTSQMIQSLDSHLEELRLELLQLQ